MIIARENILGRVRAALRVEGTAPAVPSSAPIFLAVTNVQARFREEFVALRGEFIDGADRLREFLKQFQRIATDGSELARKALDEATCGSADVRIGATGPEKSRMEGRCHVLRDIDLGVTGCDCLVAQTGSIFVSTRSAGGRALSVLPPVHLVIARRSQLTPDLDAAFALIRTRYDGHWPSSLCLISGPSRTADIEKILVMGAHGPKRLAVYFAD